MQLDRPIAELDKRISELKLLAAENPSVGLSAHIRQLEDQARRLRVEVYSDLDPWERTLLSRHPQRPFTLDYVKMLFTDFIELHGDRAFMEEPAIVTGLARFDDVPCVVMGHQKGRNTRENLHRNFGMARPEGYRKAIRIFQMAERFQRPIFTFIDTPGAYPGIVSEERGQAEAIAHAILEMTRLTVPVIVTVIGEGGSGGALAIGVGNRVLMLENSIYSVISPEACAAILWHDGTKGALAAQALKYTAQDCLKLSVADEIIKEPPGGAHLDPEGVAANLGKALRKHLASFKDMTPQQICDDRYSKVRKLGKFTDPRPRKVRGT